MTKDVQYGTNDAGERTILGVVSAVGTSANVHGTSPGSKALGQRYEKAMSDAITECYANGIVEAEKVKEAMLKAKAVVKAAYEAEVEAISKKLKEEAELKWERG